MLCHPALRCGHIAALGRNFVYLQICLSKQFVSTSNIYAIALFPTDTLAKPSLSGLTSD
jgi:hypothetical protein